MAKLTLIQLQAEFVAATAKYFAALDQENGLVEDYRADGNYDSPGYILDRMETLEEDQVLIHTQFLVELQTEQTD